MVRSTSQAGHDQIRKEMELLKNTIANLEEEISKAESYFENSHLKTKELEALQIQLSEWLNAVEKRIIPSGRLFDCSQIDIICSDSQVFIKFQFKFFIHRPHPDRPPSCPCCPHPPHPRCPHPPHPRYPCPPHPCCPHPRPHHPPHHPPHHDQFITVYII